MSVSSVVPKMCQLFLNPGSYCLLGCWVFFLPFNFDNSSEGFCLLVFMALTFFFFFLKCRLNMEWTTVWMCLSFPTKFRIPNNYRTHSLQVRGTFVDLCWAIIKQATPTWSSRDSQQGGDPCPPRDVCQCLDTLDCGDCYGGPLPASSW